MRCGLKLWDSGLEVSTWSLNKDSFGVTHVDGDGAERVELGAEMKDAWVPQVRVSWNVLKGFLWNCT